jgi:2-methylisocitrate lyase-like PEP mutase family enzyme
MTSGLARLAGRLAELHHGDRPLVLPNAWDAASARAVERAGFGAVATSSGALVRSLGYEDGSLAPAPEVFDAVGRIARSVALPVTADLEDGYGLPADELVARMLSAGVVGANLEDSDHRGTEPLVPIRDQAARLSAVRDAARGAGVDLVINARVDVFLRAVGSPQERLERALERCRAYLAAGATCVYPITAADDETVAALVERAGGPVNVMARPDPADVDRLTRLGVARISFGSGLARVLGRHLDELLGTLAGPAT